MKSFVLLCIWLAVPLAVSDPHTGNGAMEQILEANLHQDNTHSPGSAKSSYFQGDIKLTEKQQRNLRNYGDARGPGSRAASSVDKERWPNAVIPYTFDCSVANTESAVRSVKQAMQEWESKTCIRFVPRTNQRAYLEFFKHQGCWGHVGHQGYKTQISIGDNCDFKHVMVHEIGHAVGFWHEQSRPDRDSYIKVLWENVLDGLNDAFAKRKQNTEVVDYGVPYDFASIMHYPFTAFSKNGKPTIRAIASMGGKTPYVELSVGDATQTNRMYKCNAVMRKRALDDFGAFRPAPRLEKRSTDKCVDAAGTSSCQGWKSHGYCTSEAQAMHTWCKVTCNLCGSDSCMDKDGNCPAWGQNNGCQASPDVLNYWCPYTCNVCTAPPTQAPTQPPTQPPTQAPQTTHAPLVTTAWTGPPTPAPTTGPFLGATGLRCVDKSSQCAELAAKGQCDTSGWVLRNCRKSCKAKCDEQPLQPDGACASPLGLGWDYTLPDSAFSASSELTPGGGWVASASNARLYFVDEYANKRIGAWCATDRKNQWLKIDLGQKKKITGIATQGRDVFVEHVESYELEFSVDGQSWTKYQENGKTKVFKGNCDHFTPVLNRFNTVTARFVRVLPLPGYQWPCMRVELYGCGA